MSTEVQLKAELLALTLEKLQVQIEILFAERDRLIQEVKWAMADYESFLNTDSLEFPDFSELKKAIEAIEGNK